MNEFLIIFMSAMPVLERGAIPVAVFILHMSVLKAFILGVIGMSLPIIPLLLFWKYLSDMLANKFYWFNRLSAFLSDRALKRHAEHFERWENIALLIFVAIPIPLLSGIWSGSLLAYVFHVPIKRAAIMMFLGVLISNAIITSFTAGGSQIFLK